MRLTKFLACFAVMLLILICQLQPVAAQDFSALTALAEGALVGENVDEAIAGFEIRLLHDGEAVYHQAFGDWSLDRPARADSSTKTLSGALMMSLAETGESGFSLDSRLSDYLEEYDRPDFHDITIRQAFSHTSGMEGLDVLSLILMNPNITLRRAAELISLKPLENGPPGSNFAYGGLSMQVAGAAAEVASGENFIDLFHERIAAPLELSNTQFVAASDDNPRVAGGVESTATDFGRFMDMLLNEGVDRVTGTQILAMSSVEEMLSRQTTDAQPNVFSPTDNQRYGIGVWVDQLEQAGPPVDALAGGARGFHSWIDRSLGLTFTFATDLSSFGNVQTLSSMMHLSILQAISMPGDLNFDGLVDGADFLFWQRGAFGVLPGAGDLESWRANYGLSGTSRTIAIGLVPEPATWMLAAAIIALNMLFSRRSRRRFCGDMCDTAR